MKDGIVTIRKTGSVVQAPGAQFYCDDLFKMTKEDLWQKYQEALVAIKQYENT